ncbi:MAG: SCO family protein [Porticoccaceae bacterium]|jgi:protein SCO1/2|nr:SCO family protein [Porticoccaceae bacterium]MBT3799384.1 SCO family protein [Porticoccaceae bacterium]MBT4163493.1 SCO family protein [Porticoccaceae bacterium]MBT4212404.1 SCO family protein [Porticoccaceae bacterium]MBT4592256.1 SCO family protein [Porticoccaceae bacterium]
MADQQVRIRRTIIIIVCFIVVVIFGFIWRMNQPVIMSEQDLRINGAIILNTPRKFSDFDLIDHRGDAFTLQRLKGQWSMIFFGFTNCPDVCPTTLATLNETYSKLKDSEKENLQIIMVSLDPERDTVEKLGQYMPYFNAEFIGVTGNKHFIKRFTTEINIAYNQVPLDGDDYTVDHSSQIVLVNPNGHYHGFFKSPHSAIMLRKTWRSIYGTF